MIAGKAQVEDNDSASALKLDVDILGQNTVDPPTDVAKLTVQIPRCDIVYCTVLNRADAGPAAN